MEQENQISFFAECERYRKYCEAKRHLRGECTKQIFPIRKSNSEPGHIQQTTKGQQPRVSSKISQKNGNNGGVEGQGERRPSTDIKQLNNPAHSNDRVYAEDGISPCLNTMQGGNRQPFISVKSVLTPDRAEKRQNGRRFKEDGEPAFTLTAQDKHGVMINDRVIRKLTPKECERLQYFPDDYTKYGIDDKGNEVEISDSQRYKQMGNSITVSVLDEIYKKLKG